MNAISRFHFSNDRRHNSPLFGSAQVCAVSHRIIITFLFCCKSEKWASETKQMIRLRTRERERVRLNDKNVVGKTNSRCFILLAIHINRVAIFSLFTPTWTAINNITVIFSCVRRSATNAGNLAHTQTHMPLWTMGVRTRVPNDNEKNGEKKNSTWNPSSQR